MRPPGENLKLARKLGISVRSIRTFGGAAKLNAMSAECASLLLFPSKSVSRSKCSMKALGMEPGKPGRLRA